MEVYFGCWIGWGVGVAALGGFEVGVFERWGCEEVGMLGGRRLGVRCEDGGEYRVGHYSS